MLALPTQLVCASACQLSGSLYDAAVCTTTSGRKSPISPLTTSALTIESSTRRSFGCACKLSRRPVAKLSIASTSSPRASNRSVTVEPTRPEPPVTNTFMQSTLCSFVGWVERKRNPSCFGKIDGFRCAQPILRCSPLGGHCPDRGRCRVRHVGQHAAVFGTAVVKHLVPQFEAQQAPDLARKAAGSIEIGEHRLGVQERPLKGTLAAERVLHQILQLARKPLLERHRETHLVAPVDDLA